MALARSAFFSLAAALAAWTTPAQASVPVPDCRALLDQGEGVLAAPPDVIEGATRLDPQTLNGPADLVRAIAAAGGVPVVVDGGNFTGWDMRDAGRPLTNLCLIRSRLGGSRWDGLDLSGSAFVLSDMAGARFDRAVLRGVVLSDVRLAGTGMRGANLGGGSLDGGWFTDLSEVTGDAEATTGLDGWDLTEADLAGFLFECGIDVPTGCPLDRSITFTRARLTGTDLSRFPGWGSFALADARLDGTVIAPDQVRYFAEAEQVGPVVLAGGDKRAAFDKTEFDALQAGYRAAARLEQTPGFACAAAATPVERLICSEEGSNYALPRSDRRMAQLFAQVRVARPAALSEQRAWLRQRNACTTAECLASAYDRRVAQLLGQGGIPPWLPVGEPQLFVEQGVVPDMGDMSPALRDKVIPVLAAAADQSIVVTRQADGTLDAIGEAIGANAHICSLEVRGLRLDPATGWFSLFDAGGKAAPAIRLIGDEIEVYADGQPDWQSLPEIDFVSCGARARFVTGTRLAADAATVAAFGAGWER